MLEFTQRGIGIMEKQLQASDTAIEVRGTDIIHCLLANRDRLSIPVLRHRTLSL